MGRNIGIGALFTAATVALAAPAVAQERSAEALAAEIAAMRAKIESLEALVKEVEQKQKASASTAAPSWKGAPLFEDKKKGWSFKPRGRLQYDVGSRETGAAAHMSLHLNQQCQRADVSPAPF